MLFDIADGVVPVARAAAVNEPASTTRMNVLSPSIADNMEQLKCLLKHWLSQMEIII
jgi:hypothetical protein